MHELTEKLKLFNQGLLPEMVALKYAAMAENAFRYYRGTCHLFYDDLINAGPKTLPFSPQTWICGDLHLENFGSYKADNKLVYFDLNDFDEAVLAPSTWELSRMVTSILIAFDVLKFGEEKALKMAQLYVKTYVDTLANGKAISIDPRTAKGIVCDFLKQAEHSKQKDILEKRTITKQKELVLSLSDERHFKLKKPLRKELYKLIENWIETSSDGPYNYEVKSAVFRLAGTGSVGVKRYLFLLKSTNTKGKYLLLDMKQARASSVKVPAKIKQPQWTNEAERVIAVQKRMQNVSASLLSTISFNGDDYIIQELQPVKDTIKFKLLSQYRDIYEVISDMAILTASSQLRSGGIQGSAIIDELMEFGNNTTWQQPLIDYCINYALKVKGDYRGFLRDFKNGAFNNPL